jgi:hypothetical protein
LYATLGGSMRRTCSIGEFRLKVKDELRKRFSGTDAYGFLTKLLCDNPAQRPTAAECLEEIYIMSPTNRPADHPTPVAQFQGALPADVREEEYLKTAIRNHRKAKAPCGRKRRASRKRVQGGSKQRPVLGGRISKIRSGTNRTM